MRIERITLKSYRQYRDLDMKLPKREHDLHFFIATGGTGKSNLVNAVNWCLYGDEPHLSDESKSLPVINLRSLRQTGSRDVLPVVVEIWVTDQDNKPVSFSRKAWYRVTGGQASLQRSEFEATCIDSDGNTTILQEEDAEALAQRFAPQSLRGFFLFDGERLGNYFKRETGQQIRNSVFEISQVSLLQRMEERLDGIVRELTREASKNDPDVKATQDEVEQLERSLSQLDAQIEELERDIAIASDRIKELEVSLRQMPNVQEYEHRRQEIKKLRERRVADIQTAEDEKRELVFQLHKALSLHPAIEDAISVINAKRDSREIPPPIDRDLLREALASDECSLCGQMLEKAAKERIASLLEEFSLSTEVGLSLHAMEDPLRRLLDLIPVMSRKVRSLQQRINHLHKEIEEYDKEEARIDSYLSQYDVEAVQELHRERTNLDSSRDQKNRQLGILLGSQSDLESKLGAARKKLDREFAKEGKHHELRKQIRFGARAVECIRSAKEEIMARTRDRVARETNRLFFELIWKKHSFKEVSISEDYAISVTSRDGFECMGSLAASETALLALAFTLALHEVSGFECPLFIDTPVSRISDIQRENFASVLARVSQSKQTIILFTPAEYSSELASILDPIGAKHQLRLSKDELEVSLGVLQHDSR